jgi:hypothetical protein
VVLETQNSFPECHSGGRLIAGKKVRPRIAARGRVEGRRRRGEEAQLKLRLEPQRDVRQLWNLDISVYTAFVCDAHCCVLDEGIT